MLDLVSYPARVEELGKYDKHLYTHLQYVKKNSYCYTRMKLALNKPLELICP